MRARVPVVCLGPQSVALCQGMTHGRGVCGCGECCSPPRLRLTGGGVGLGDGGMQRQWPAGWGASTGRRDALGGLRRAGCSGLGDKVKASCGGERERRAEARTESPDTFQSHWDGPLPKAAEFSGVPLGQGYSLQRGSAGKGMPPPWEGRVCLPGPSP